MIVGHVMFCHLSGDMLYFTKSNSGLYRINRKDTRDKIWPHPTATGEKKQQDQTNAEHKDTNTHVVSVFSRMFRDVCEADGQ